MALRIKSQSWCSDLAIAPADIHCIAVDRFAPTRAQLRVIQGRARWQGLTVLRLSAGTLDPAKKRVSLTVDRRNGAALRRGQPEFRSLLLGACSDDGSVRSQKSGRHLGSQEKVAHLMQIAGNEGAGPSDFVSGFEEIGHHHRHHAGGGCRPDSIV